MPFAPKDPTSLSVDAVREKLFADLASVEVYAAATGKSRRSVERLIASGLPIVKMGNTPYIVLSKAAAFVMSTMRVHEPVRRGRPRKVA